MKGDMRGKYPYIGARGFSVIDYVITRENLEREIIVDIEVITRGDSDHMLLVTTAAPNFFN